MKTRDEIASSIERSIGTAIPTLFFSDDDLRVIISALRQPPEGERKEAFEDAAQRCRYYLKHQNFGLEPDDYELGVTAACENLEKIMLEAAEELRSQRTGDE